MGCGRKRHRFGGRLLARAILVQQGRAPRLLAFGLLRRSSYVWRSAVTPWDASHATTPVEFGEERSPQIDERAAWVIQHREDGLAVIDRECNELVALCNGVQEDASRVIGPVSGQLRREFECLLARGADSGDNRHGSDTKDRQSPSARRHERPRPYPCPAGALLAARSLSTSRSTAAAGSKKPTRRSRRSSARSAAIATSDSPAVDEQPAGQVGNNILAYVPDGRAGAATLEVARRLAETSGGWLTVAVSFEQPSWETMCRAIGGVTAHPSQLDTLAQLRLQDHLDALPSHVKTHGVILRGSVVAALLGRAESASHDVIVVPASRRPGCSARGYEDEAQFPWWSRTDAVADGRGEVPPLLRTSRALAPRPGPSLNTSVMGPGALPLAKVSRRRSRLRGGVRRR